MPDLSIFGLRDYLLLAAGLVAIYLVVQLLKLRRPSRTGADLGRTESNPAPQQPRWEPVTMDLELSDRDFASQLLKSEINLEVQQLRRETVQLREDLTQLTEEVRQLKATHNVSPIYSEAMSLAERGELPEGIAARCGISIGEAELVAALARREFGAAVDDELEDRQKQPGN